MPFFERGFVVTYGVRKFWLRLAVISHKFTGFCLERSVYDVQLKAER